ncbi:UDP-N-acetylmuramoyl-tripeptide--D-alanyl-D-alanine ligase [Marinobacter caseinilyticus]|uniref:UDP-N-acetylmuramoyl-tripeptide--D-alanyl-D- alanine ligase n=1 Tax=Marinobacter caseinilyticus TaxID=2692195 RepID=UPI00140B7B24|nr:UDP-N-acetylmuramoyl-tripeptide--D-alanyl-D-alanine ligase [Marinobacter caseinilyticus]
MMRQFSLLEAAGWMGASGGVKDGYFSGVSTDTRSLQSGDLFVALRGENFDGHRFIEMAEQAGAVAAVVDECNTTCTLPQLQVADTTAALADLAQGNRRESRARVVAITGSSGKTTVKEMVASILQQVDSTLATQGNLNNHIGVPLTLFRLTPTHRFAVIELGASGLGEIAHTVAIVRPDVAIITNAAEAHLEGFGSYGNVVQAKGEIIDGVPALGSVILNHDDAAFDQWRQRAGNRKVVTVTGHTDGQSGQSVDYRCDDWSIVDAEQRMRVQGPDRWSCNVSLSLLGDHNRLNALLAIAAARELGVDNQAIQAGLAAIQPVPGRLQPIVLSPDVVVIDDSYNANPASMRAALSVLASRPGNRIVVLGAMAELGPDADRLHREVGAFAKALGIVQLLAVGDGAKGYLAGFGEGGRACHDHGEAIEFLKQQLAAPVTVLVKGSRSSAMNVVVEGIQHKVTR